MRLGSLGTSWKCNESHACADGGRRLWVACKHVRYHERSWSRPVTNQRVEDHRCSGPCILLSGSVWHLCGINLAASCRVDAPAQVLRDVIHSKDAGGIQRAHLHRHHQGIGWAYLSGLSDGTNVNRQEQNAGAPFRKSALYYTWPFPRKIWLPGVLNRSRIPGCCIGWMHTPPHGMKKSPSSLVKP